MQSKNIDPNAKGPAHDELIYRPDFKKGTRGDPVPTLSRGLVERLARGGSLTRSHRSGGSVVRRRHIDVRPYTTDGLRQVVIKARVVKVRSKKNAALKTHVAYLKRDGVGREGQQGQLYGRDRPVEARAFSKPLPKEVHHFRFIISPEDAAELDLTLYTRELMNHMEEDLGRKLKWAAVNHYNTEHPHVHVVVHGVDAQGKVLRIPRDYMADGFRLQAQNIATKELGPKCEWELEQKRRQDLHAQRFTRLDRQLEAKVSPENEIALSDKPSSLEQRWIGRLCVLERLGLAKRIAPHAWRMESGWTQSLKALGMRNDIIKQMHHYLSREAIASNRLHIKQHPSDVDQPIEGKVVAKGMHDELYDKPFVLIATADGAAHYVLLHEARELESIREQSIVRVHKEQETRALSRDEERRPRQVERLRLTTVSALSLDQQCTLLGPTWLDQEAVRGKPRAGFGFGAELDSALYQRQAFLKEIGIDPHAKEVTHRLLDLEESRLAKDLKAKRGLKAVKGQEHCALHGTLERHTLQSGRRVACLVNEGAGTVAVLPWQKSYEAFEGKQVTLTQPGHVIELLRKRSLGMER